MSTYFNLAHGTRLLEHASNAAWPYDIDICFDEVERPIAFSEGEGQGQAGCTVSAVAALAPQWQAHFAITKGEWLIPFIEALAAGTPLPREDMLAAYRKRHGSEPTSWVSQAR